MNENVENIEETKPELTTKMVEKETFGKKAKKFFKTHWKKLVAGGVVGGGIIAAFAGGATAQKKYDELKNDSASWSNEPEPDHDVTFGGDSEE